MAILPNGFVVIDRPEWGARHSAGRSPMPAQVDQVYFHHSVTRATDDPCADMRTIEQVLDSRGLAPGYSFVVHPSGVVLIGAGSNKGAHTEGRNGASFGLCFVGNFDKESPTIAALVAAARTINLLRLSGQLTPQLEHVQLGLHRDTKATACPGAHLASIVGPDGQPRSVATWVRLFAGLGL